MLKGGYDIIDFKDVNITTETGATITGIYNAIAASYRKALLVSGITLDGVEQRDCFIDCTHAENSYTFTAHGKTFTITNEDKITIA